MAATARPRRQAPGIGALGQLPLRFTTRRPGQLMAWLRRLARGRALPATLRAQFARGERTLMASRHPDLLVATDRALYHPAGPDGWSRLGWEQIAGVSWETSPGRLVVSSVAGAAPARVSVPLRRRGTWAELAEERITHTRLSRQQVMLGGQQRAVIEIRRRPVTGELRWVLVSGRDLDPGDPHLRHQIERAVTRVCADLGLAGPLP